MQDFSERRDKAVIELEALEAEKELDEFIEENMAQ